MNINFITKVNMQRVYRNPKNNDEIDEEDLDDYSRYYVEDNGDHYIIRNPNYPRNDENGYSKKYKDKHGKIITDDIEEYSEFFDEKGNKYRNTIKERNDIDERSSTPDMPAPVALMQPVTDGVVKHSNLSKTASMKSIPQEQQMMIPQQIPQQMMIPQQIPQQMMILQQQRIPPDLVPKDYYMLYSYLPIVMNFRPNQHRNSISFKSTNKDFISLTVDDNTLSMVTIGPCTFNIGNILGVGRAIVYDITSYNLGLDTPLCIKIAKHGDIVFNDKKLKHINDNNNDFANVYYYYANVKFNTYLTLNDKELGDNIDICILEQTTTTLDKLIKDNLTGRNKFSVKAFSYKFLSYLTNRLIEIAVNLNKNDLCYTDIKAENIGLIKYGHYSPIYIKLVDVDTIDNVGSMSTPSTSGRIAPNINIIRIQYLNIFFTIISLLFLNDSDRMCSNAYSKYYVGSEMRDYMSWFDATIYNDPNMTKWLRSNTECMEYKYALLVGTFKIMDDFFGGPRFTFEDISGRYPDIVNRVCHVILNKDRCIQDNNGCSIITDVSDDRIYFLFIAQCLVIMVALFKCSLNDVPNVLNLLKAPYENIFSFNEFFDNIMLDAETSIGVSITNIMRRYAVGYCRDKTCSDLEAYGEAFLNINN